MALRISEIILMGTVSALILLLVFSMKITQPKEEEYEDYETHRQTVTIEEIE